MPDDYDFATVPIWWACGRPGSRERMDWWPCLGGPPLGLLDAGWQLFWGSVAEIDALTTRDDRPVWPPSRAGEIAR